MKRKNLCLGRQRLLLFWPARRVRWRAPAVRDAASDTEAPRSAVARACNDARENVGHRKRNAHLEKKWLYWKLWLSGVRIPQKKKRTNGKLALFLARSKGFEPPFFRIGICCVIQLRHERKYSRLLYFTTIYGKNQIYRKIF